MTDPYKVLELTHDADQAAIRQRYLQLVRRHSPERDPQRFAEIRAAYDQLRDPLVSLEKRLFDVASTETLEDILRDVQTSSGGRRLATKLLLSLGEP